MSLGACNNGDRPTSLFAASHDADRTTYVVAVHPTAQGKPSDPVGFTKVSQHGGIQPVPAGT
jgi:hypothetical protein